MKLAVVLVLAASILSACATGVTSTVDAKKNAAAERIADRMGDRH